MAKKKVWKVFYLSVVRTVTPVIAGFVVSLFVWAGVEPDPGMAEALRVAVDATLVALWYVGARLLETYVSPKFGWLLGAATAPDYSEAESQ